VNDLCWDVDRALTNARIPRGTAILAAVSGGADSVAMLRALCALRDTRGLLITACTVDHGIRQPEETAAEARFVADLCAGLGVSHVVRTVPPGLCAERARSRHQGLEETARDIRHALLRQAAADLQADVIALGHTEDDAVETLLMRILSGADVDGFRGIPLRRGPFIRPLLRCTRARVVEYLRSLDQAWREDPSNADVTFQRNRVRHTLVPVLEAGFPGYRAGLFALSRKLSLTADFIAGEASKLAWKEIPSGFSITIEDFYAAAPAIRARSLLSLYDRMKPPGSPRRLPWRFLEPALNEAPPPGAGYLLRGHGVALSVRAGRLFWVGDIARRGKKGYFIEVSATGDVGIQGAGIHLRVEKGPGTAAETVDVLSILSREVNPPVVCRSFRSGDEILLESGLTSVNDVMAGWKIPSPEREMVPLLADRRGVLAVLGGALGYCTRARAGALGGNRGDEERMVVRMEHDMEEGREQQ
jgi:tRNA(Ile)-lysidine synthase